MAPEWKLVAPKNQITGVRFFIWKKRERERADAAEKYGEPASYDFPN